MISHIDNLEGRAVAQTRALLLFAAKRLGARMPDPEIRFDLRGKAAGQARSLGAGAYLVRYNRKLLQRHGDAFLNQTVPHEAAHLVTFRLYGTGVRPHGPEWQAVMRLFGAVPERCHTYDVSGLAGRQLRELTYTCPCRTHRLTSIRHNRALAGQVYLCRHCGGALRYCPEPAAAGTTALA